MGADMGLLKSARISRLAYKGSKPLAKGLGLPPYQVHRGMVQILNRPVVTENAENVFYAGNVGNHYDMVVFLIEHGLCHNMMRENPFFTERLFETLKWWESLGLYDLYSYAPSSEWIGHIKRSIE